MSARIRPPESQVTIAGACAHCAAPMTPDQRYCLQCGEVRAGARRELPAALRRSLDERESAVVAEAPAGELWPPSLATALAGLACLLLAVAIGVLIGRSGSGGASAPAPITIAAPVAAPQPSAAFAGDWPVGKDGWTVALQVLPKASTLPAAVASAKTAAAGKGATAVGALDADAYPTLTAGSYVVYAGVHDDRKAATAALAALKASFPAARAVHVAATAGAASSGASGGASAPAKRKAATTSSGGADDTKQAFEESKKAPTTVGTGGKPPPTDNKQGGGGSDFEEIG